MPPFKGDFWFFSMVEFIWADVFVYLGYFLLAFALSSAISLLLAFITLPFLREKVKDTFSEIFLLLSSWPFAIYVFFLLPFFKKPFILFAFYSFFPLGQFLKFLKAPHGLKKALYSFGARGRHFGQALFSYCKKAVGFILFFHFLRISSDFLSFLYLRNSLIKKISWQDVLFDTNFFILLGFNLSMYIISLVFFIFFPKKIEGDFFG